MHPSLDRSALTVVCATSLEYRIARTEIAGVRIIHGGVGLCRLAEREFGGSIVSCGLAGGLREDLPTGTVVVPNAVQRPDGTHMDCDADLVSALRESARAVGLHCSERPLLTTSEIVRGLQRAVWAQRGFGAADMETGLLAAPRIAAVRVILDTPQHELDAAWLEPATLVFHPRAWLELPWLAREGPRCARLAARVVSGALGF